MKLFSNLTKTFTLLTDLPELILYSYRDKETGLPGSAIVWRCLGLRWTFGAADSRWGTAPPSCHWAVRSQPHVPPGPPTRPLRLPPPSAREYPEQTERSSTGCLLLRHLPAAAPPEGTADTPPARSAPLRCPERHRRAN